MSHLSGGVSGERRYLVPQGHPHSHQSMAMHGPAGGPPASEDLHAWSIYRQNLNSDFTDSALGSSDKSPLPYGNFQLRDTTVQSILSHPRYGPKSALGSNMYTYLKFGLPRVFPPNHGGVRDSQRSRRQAPPSQRSANRGRVNRGYKNGSSGYDSSDNETSRHTKLQRKYRSDPDFLSNGRGSNVGHYNPQMSGIPLVALQQASSRVSVAMGQGQSPSRHHPGQGSGLGNYRSASEANLLSSSYPHYNRRGSIADIGALAAEMDYAKGRKAESIISGTQAPSLKDYPYSMMMSSGIAYPNIQFLNLEVSCTPVSIIGVSLQARAGDLVAVMATVEEQGSCLLETIAGVRKKIAGDVLLNGQHVNMRALRRRISWAPRRECLHPYNSHLTVYTTLKFYSQLKYPQRGKADMTDRISILIEELGLEQVKHMTVCRLTDSETQRLTVACQLLQDTAILVLDQPTKGMDIFDTFFLIEYLRQYAANGRIVILSLQPPTYEIFLMCSGILLLSSGRVMYSGSRVGFVEHFTNVGYPCPMYKNPSDYYLDLVTLDDLSAAAMLESSGRIESLAEMWASQGLPNLLPDPPAALPEVTVKPNAFVQAIVLLKLFLVYSQPNTIVSWVFRVFMSIVISLIIGAIFWDLPSSDPQLNLNDRLGYHYAVSALCLWPIMLCTVYRDLKNIKSVERDIRMGMYGRFTYIFMKLLCSIPPSICIWLAYIAPAHTMTGMVSYSNMQSVGYSAIYTYIGYTVLYLMCLQLCMTFIAYLVRGQMKSALIASVILIFVLLPGGLTVHSLDLGPYIEWIEYASPLKWLLPVITAKEFNAETIQATTSHLLCRNKQVQNQDIIVQMQCPPPNGTLALSAFRLLPGDHVLDPRNMQTTTATALGVSCAAAVLITIAAFAADCSGSCRTKRRKQTRL